MDILKEARWSRRIAPTIPQLESGLCTLECDIGMMRVSIINERHSHECCTFVDGLSKCRSYCEMSVVMSFALSH